MDRPDGDTMVTGTTRIEVLPRSRSRSVRETVRRAFEEFLTLPTVIITAFLLVAAGTFALDHHAPGPISPWRHFMEEHALRSSKATGDLLATVTTGLITILSITFSLLLVAVQQSAAALTNQVFDQFMRRRFNQFYFGFFVGLTLYCLVILATVDAPYNPVCGASIALLLTAVALFLLIVLLYTTLDQMRPSVIIEAIHGHTLAAIERRRAFLREVRPSPGRAGPVRRRVLAAWHGYVVRIDARAIARSAEEVRGGTEVVLCVAVGSFVGFRDEVAEVRAETHEGADRLARAVWGAIVLERQRDLAHDPAFGIEQLHMIGWTSVSTAKSNPYPGLLVIRSLRDLLLRLCDEREHAGAEPGPRDASPVAHADDVPVRVMDALESLAVAASESMQHMTLAEIYRNLAMAFGRLTPDLRHRGEGLVLRSLSALGDHVLTAELDAAMEALARSLTTAGRSDSAAAVRTARQELQASVGELNSRSTRAGIRR